MAVLLNAARRAAANVIRDRTAAANTVSPSSSAWKRAGGVRALCTNQAFRNIVRSPVPDIALPSGNLIHTVFAHVNQWGSKTAVECSVTGRSYTYNQVLEGVSKWAGFLTTMGLKQGDVVAILMLNCPEYPIVVLGAVSIGVVVTGINSNYTSEEVSRHLIDSGAKLLVGEPLLEATIIDSLAKYNTRIPLIMNGPSNVSGALNLHNILHDPTIPYVDPVELTGNEPATMPYSSGTTGPPKGVITSHNANAGCVIMFNHPAFFPTRTTTDDFQDTYMCLPPFYHVYGLMVFILLGFRVGVKVVTIPKFEPNHYIETLKKHKVETLHTVPPMLNFLVNSPAATPDVLASLKCIICAAAPVLPTVAEAFVNKFGRHVFFQEAYGMTEVLLTNQVPRGSNRLGTCGLLIPNVKAKIVDTLTGEDLPSTATGEICFKTPTMMSGYFKNEAATSAVIDKDGWLHSGDVGNFDEEGFLKIVDRTKELIKVKGLQVSPSELEDVIRQHPQVLDVGVVGVPHERNGEAPRAYVVTRDDAEIEGSIHSFVESRVAPHKRLVGGIAFVKELPKTPTGKLLRRELKNMALR